MARERKAKTQTFSEKFWHDKDGKFVVWSRPNVFLWVWIAATVISIIMNSNSVSRAIVFVGGISIFIWAVLEIFKGVNYFRRLLGFCVLLLIIVSKFL